MASFLELLFPGAGITPEQVRTTFAIAERDRIDRETRAAGDSIVLGKPEIRPFYTDSQVAQASRDKVALFPERCGTFDFACKIGEATDSLGRGVAKVLFVAGIVGVGYLAFKLS